MSRSVNNWSTVTHACHPKKFSGIFLKNKTKKTLQKQFYFRFENIFRFANVSTQKHFRLKKFILLSETLSLLFPN